MPFTAAQIGGRSVGTPGVLRALELAHRKHGRLKWATLFEPAIKLAEQGSANNLAAAVAKAIIEAGGELYFYANDGGTQKLWRSDGTAAAGADGVLVEEAVAGDGLAGVEQDRAGSGDGVGIAAGHRGDAGQMLQRVQR